MTPAEFQAIQGRINTKPNVLYTASLLLVDAGLMLAIAYASTQMALGNGLYLLLQAILSVVFFHHFAILHEAGHGNCASSDLVNTLIGHYSSIFCWMPFYSWKYIHYEHHLWAGNVDMDPTMSGVRRFNTNKKARIFVNVLWLSWIPALAVIQHIFLYAYPLRLLKRGKPARRKLLQTAFSVTFLIACYGSLLSILPLNTLAVAVGPAILFYMFLTELINFPHHLATKVIRGNERLRPWVQFAVTRTCYFPRFVSELLMLNFNFHSEHHLVPNLPWYRLRDLNQKLLSNRPAGYNESRWFKWNFNYRFQPAERVFIMPDLVMGKTKTSHSNDVSDVA